MAAGIFERTFESPIDKAVGQELVFENQHPFYKYF